MEFHRTFFEYRGKKIIEKVVFEPPYQNEVFFRNEGCILHFKNVNATLFSSEDHMAIKNNNTLLLRCGVYFFDLMKKINDQQVEVIAIHLHPEILKDIYIKELPSLIKKRDYQKETHVISPQNVITTFMESFELYFKNPHLVTNELLELKLKELILLLVQTKNVNSLLELVTDLYSSKTADLKKVVDLHLYSNLQIEQYAKLCYMSLSSFNREFKKKFNDSPKNYILLKRIEKAKELLSFTNMSVKEIAFEVGFNDPLYFTRIFKKKTGMSPTNFIKTKK